MKKYIVEVYTDRTVWKNEAEQLHREDGPSVEYANGHKQWYVNGKRHRLDGPAVEYANGHKQWYVNGKRHRENGPAIEWTNGDKEWHVKGKRHRLDGPAVEYANGDKQWWVEDEQLSESKFNKKTKQLTCDGRIVEVDGVKYKLTKLK